MHYDSEGNAYLPSNIKNKSLQEIVILVGSKAKEPGKKTWSKQVDMGEHQQV